jgi:hypothetical protein
MGVAFQEAISLCRGLDNLFHINGIGFSFVDKPAGGVTENAEKAVAHGPDDTLGLFPGGKIELRMDRTDGEVEFLQDIIVQIQAAVAGQR